MSESEVFLFSRKYLDDKKKKRKKKGVIIVTDNASIKITQGFFI